MVPYTLHEYAEAYSLLSTTQAGFRRQKDTFYQLPNVIMALEDAKLFSNNIYALIVDLTSAFNTTDLSKTLRPPVYIILDHRCFSAPPIVGSFAGWQ